MESESAWLARGETHLPPSPDWLTERERGYADRQRFSKRRVEFLIARLTAKTTIARRLGLPETIDDLSRIEIRHEPTGAPFLCVDGERSALGMSLTDRAGWAVCLVGTGGGRWGCDLELVEPRSDGFVADWLTPVEQRYVAAADGADARALAANLIWSAKESALKVLGTGLRRDTRSVEVRLEPGPTPGDGWQPLTVHPVEGGAFPGWWSRFGDFVLTMAGEHPSEPPRALDDPPLLLAAQPEHTWLQRPAIEPQQ